MEASNSLKALIIGSTGAIGRELVRELVQSNRWSEVHVIVRRELEQWSTFSEAEKQKLKIIKMDNLDDLKETNKLNQFGGLNSVFCCLGTRTKTGKENFINVDYNYPLYTADIALLNKIPHYHLVSSTSADKTSMFFYLKTKGQVEAALAEKKMPILSIYRPALLLNRDNDARFFEKCAGYVPFISKIEVRDVAKAMKIKAEAAASNLSSEPPVSIYENKAIINIATPPKK